MLSPNEKNRINLKIAVKLQLNIRYSMIDECYDSDVTFLRKTENLAKYTNSYQFAYFKTILLFNLTSVTRLGNLLEFGQLFKAFGNN